MKPTVSIVTISYNAAREIEATIRSVLCQTFSDLEYIFVDGKSKDDTLSIISNYEAQLVSRGIACQVVSEPDRGIYDAMNKGIRLARGQWVLMLNAGDVLAHERVLENFFGAQTYSADIVYGDVIYKDKSKGKTYYKRSAPQPLENIRKGMVFCHQCVFVRGEVLKAYGFDTQYKLVADYDSFVRAYLDNIPFQYVDKVVAIYDCTGASTESLGVALAETAEVKKRAGFEASANSMSGRIFRYRHLLRRFIQRNFPSVAYAKKRGWQDQPPIDRSK